MTRDDANREIIVDWRGATSDTIGQYMAQLKNTPEFGGNFCVFDISEEDRTGASQKEMEVHRQRRLEVQRAEETLEQLKLLQPSVCSIGGIFGAAELGNNPVMDAFIKGYPKPLYDPKTGKSVPNPDRRAVPENKHQLRAQQQLAHRPTRLQYSHENCVPAGDPLDDLRLAAPHLLAQAYDESSILKVGAFCVLVHVCQNR